MCYCTPSIRTPQCGSTNCHPHKSERPMQGFQQRVVEERDELRDKMTRLNMFICASGAFDRLPLKEQGLMHAQANIMSMYIDVLNERIAEFKVEGYE